MIRDRDWDRSETAFLTPDDKREELREQIIRKYGAAFELIEPPRKAREDRQKKRKSPTPTSRPKPVQPPLPDEPLVDYTEQDIIETIEAVVRATTKAMAGGTWVTSVTIFTGPLQTSSLHDSAARTCCNSSRSTRNGSR